MIDTRIHSNAIVSVCEVKQMPNNSKIELTHNRSIIRSQWWITQDKKKMMTLFNSFLRFVLLSRHLFQQSLNSTKLEIVEVGMGFGTVTCFELVTIVASAFGSGVEGWIG